MSNVYRIHGSRFLRKYTAKERSSCYSYMADVRTIANTLCEVPWERVRNDVAATNTIHTEEGLDWNVVERDRFDAAEWCGEHSAGYHRAFAQAACYVFELPDSAVGIAIEKIRVNVTSDPYNPYGARISAMTSSTLDIPTACAIVREGEVFRAPDENGLGAAPRIFVRDAKTGRETWYANSEAVELVPADSLELKKYLFVFVCLENYNRGRDGWIEGSSYIDNDVEITLSSPCADLDVGEINDLVVCGEEREFAVAVGGVYPSLPSDRTGIKTICLQRNGDDLTALFRANGVSQGSPALLNLSQVVAELDGEVTSVSVSPPILTRLTVQSAVGDGSASGATTVSFDANQVSQFAVVVGKFKRSSLAMMPGVIVYDMVTGRVLENIRCNNVNANVINAANNGTITGCVAKVEGWSAQANGYDLAALRHTVGLCFSFESGRAPDISVAFAYDGLTNEVAADVLTLNSVTFDQSVTAPFVVCSARLPAATPISAWSDTRNILFRIDGGKIREADQSTNPGDSATFPSAGVAYQGRITSIRAMEPTDDNRRRIVVAGDLSSVGGVTCRNCAVITFNSTSATVSVPAFDSLITPDDYDRFAVAPKVRRVTRYEFVRRLEAQLLDVGFSGASDSFVVSGAFTRLSGDRRYSKCVVVDSDGGRYAVAAASTHPVVVGATATSDDAVLLYGRGTVENADPVIDAARLFPDVTAEQSAIGLRTIYARLYQGSLYDVTKAVAARPFAGFCVVGDSVSVTAVDVGGESSSVSVPVWRLSLASFVLPFSIPRDFTARRLSLGWPSLVATAHSVVNVWIKGDYVSEVPDVRAPAFFDGSSTTVDGWTLLGRIDATSATRTATFDLPNLGGYVATLLFTAFISLDDLNPSDDMTLPCGVGEIDVDLAGEVFDADSGFRPDVTLVGW